MELSNEIMLDMLQKVQQQQIEILKSGLSCHVDAGVYEHVLYSPGKHIGFGLTVFEEDSIVRDFDFSSNMIQEELDAEYGCLVAYVKRIKAE